MKQYTILKNGKLIKSSISGEYAGYVPRKIFGCLNCKTGMRMKKENRVFFHSLEDAVMEGYRPCKNCKPMDGKDFEKIKHLIPYETLREFYDKDKKPMD
jgi:methylphosphotriester-DNA--protein-cysteine methyltransferase